LSEEKKEKETVIKETIESEEIDLREILNVLKKRRKIIALITVISLFTSAVLSLFVLSPVYETKSKLLVTMATDDTRRTVAAEDDLESVISTVSRLPQLTINSYVEQLKSEALMQRVIEEMDIEDTLKPRQLASMVNVQAVPDSNIIEVKIQNTNPQFAVDALNRLNKEYLELLSENNQEQMSRSMVFLQEQKEEKDKQLEEALAKLKEFNSQPRGVEYLEKEFTLMADDLNQYNSQLDMLGVEVRQLQAGVNRLVEDLQNEARTVTVNKYDPVAGETVVSEELNPVYVSLTEKLNEKEALLAENMARREAIMAVTERMQRDINNLQAELSQKRFTQEQLQKEVDMLKETSNLLAQKTTQTQIARSIDMGNTSVVVVSPAIESYQVKPNVKLNVAVALVLGLMIGVGLAFLLEFMDNTLKNSEDVNKLLDIPVMGVIPDLSSKK
jgi:capsular polysaccharide biosynthesis protein